ncbi:MAG: SUMF1/EgtB/PvdO family nonheme iron enzyme, partial [Elusimicrobia bacterium]|nr:SUMF1/EgtB/PvdO family nonheme iron enzyme [Elusimicrobiota bacterium]
MSVPEDPQRPPPETLTLGPSPQNTLTLGPGATAPGQAAGWAPGAVIDELYEVRSILGAGGFGSVHKVYHRAWKMELAVKSPREDRVSDRRALELFVQEANTWVGLGLHPHITACYFVRVLGLPRIFVEYMEGGSLSDWLRLGQVKDLKAVLDMAIQLARAMEYAQGRGLVHRDLKPGNCLMTPGGTLKVTDFGLAKVGGAQDVPDAAPEPPEGAKIARVREATMTGRLGTPEYMAPEQWYQAGKATGAADVWAFGVILHELAAGGRPFAMADDEPPDAFYARMLESQWRYEPPQGMPEGLARLIVSCLAADPARRPQGFTPLRESLEESYAKLGAGPYPREAVRDTPLSADVLNNQGVSLADLGRGAEALRLFASALKVDPTHPGAVYNEGLLLLGAGRLDAAGIIARLAQSAKARPKDWTPRYLQGLVLASGKAGPLALAEFDAVLAASPGNPRAAAARQRAESGSGTDRLEFFVALPQGAESARMTDTAFQALLARARAELEAGQWGKAYQTASKARGVQGQDRSPQVLDLIAELGLRGVRQGLKAGWQKQAFAGSGPAACAGVSPDGRLVLSAHEDRTLRLWELGTGRLLWSREAGSGAARAVGFLPDGKTALSAGADGTLQVWDLGSGARARELPGHAGPVNALSVSSDGRYALTASDDKTIWLWDLAAGGRLRSLTAHAAPVTTACLSPDCRRAVSGGQDGVLRCWDLSRAELQREFPGHVGAVQASAVSADGRRLVSAGADQALRLWDLAAPASQPRLLLGHQGPVRGACFTPEGRFVLSAGEDGRLIVWDASSGKRAWTFEGQTQGFSSVCASPEARCAVTAGKDGVLVWELDWEFSFPESSDWHEGAQPLLESFLSRRSFASGPGEAPAWSDAEFAGLLTDLSRKGYGWLKPEAVRSRLQSLSGTKEKGHPRGRLLLLSLAAGLVAAALILGLLRARRTGAGGAFARRESPADRIQPAQPAPPPAAAAPEAALPKPAAPADDMALIPAGPFLMGSSAGEGSPDQQPRHQVALAEFRIDRLPVTAAQYRAFSEAKGRAMREQPPWSAGDHPVVNVDWEDAAAYCRWRGARLPTEAEFEKAARGGTQTRFSFGDDAAGLPDHAWFAGNSEGRTHPVGQKRPNPSGLYDMAGNASQWTADWYSGDYYRRSPPRDPRGPSEGKFRVVRGSSWAHPPEWNVPAFRSRSEPARISDTRGFRCA